mmetsp:Transcript_30654/g.39522  ORF Transcript_30654/g.39522 Transcript_30654/m.39522 type:complete len:152 (+) Transcript_30654:1479-1934(+)
MIHTSSTMAFMKLKKSSSRFMTVSDLERILFNLNIDPPRSIVQQLYNDMDKNKDQEITCAEFLKYFGSHINGFAGSFETKPDWFYTELSALSAHIDRLEGNYEVCLCSLHCFFNCVSYHFCFYFHFRCYSPNSLCFFRMCFCVYLGSNPQS